MGQGRFFVLEGVDGVGTTTHSRQLVGALCARGIPTYWTCEPSQGAIGKLIRQFLKEPAVLTSDSLHWAEMALLFAADRLDHLENEVKPRLRAGGIVVADRYDASSLAYQSLDGGGDKEEGMDWIRTLNRYVLRPDLVLVLDIPAELAALRRMGRNQSPELYEREEMQRDLVSFYHQLHRHMPLDPIVYIDATGAIEETQARIVKAVQPFLPSEGFFSFA
ncbi:dTMP kinase [Pajaroellobacter abortibovis]|uniref:Thymidylate kinase n=1 Tax=Pajaroellobacter abortibovis TaxID=1882918 RepID=A0A1L6MVJ8_9BACT|nr:dTMP kinase [Pajaroellobacter abortibovis]APR99569.1 dTMP kinase [Pajaroellobacter abortibovis]